MDRSPAGVFEVTHYRTRGTFPQEEIKSGEIKALNQEEQILVFFRRHPELKLTPREVLSHVNPEWEITSVRRAMTNLSDGNFLVKLDEVKPERKGKSNHLWTLNSPGQLRLGI